jgi:hypothetical protein
MMVEMGQSDKQEKQLGLKTGSLKFEFQIQPYLLQSGIKWHHGASGGCVQGSISFVPLKENLLLTLEQ